MSETWSFAWSVCTSGQVLALENGSGGEVGHYLLWIPGVSHWGLAPI